MGTWKTSYGTITVTPNPRSEGWTVKNDGVATHRTLELQRALDYVAVVYGVLLTQKERGLS